MAARDGKTAKRYARSLFELCRPEDLDRVRDALQGLAQAWEQNVEFRNSIFNPNFRLTDKLAVLRDIAQQLAPGDERLSNFLCVLQSNNRLDYISQIAEAFSDLLDELKEILSLEITSAFAINEDERQQVLKQIQSDFGSLASIAWEVDKEILGGLLIKSGDRLLDSSIRGSLEKVRSSLVA